MPFTWSLSLAILFQRKTIFEPPTTPAAEPIPFAPLHVPATLFPTCRKTHTGAVAEIAECPMTPEMAHAPAKSAALTTAGENAVSTNPTSAKRNFVVNIVTFLIATNFG
jgi:hypothetical protein